ncbi:MAG TPA: DUF4337 domain-containing protein [candidate division Zixibacteria bacterium]|nr:DUF4337 domain-containing protein [candidate division Zixibacteria bacterium]
MSENDLEELQESAEHGREQRELAPVSLTMAILAVLVAISGLLGHRSHTEETVVQNQATDQWNFYQAKHGRRTLLETKLSDIALWETEPQAPNRELAQKQSDDYHAQITKLKNDEEGIMDKARDLEAERDRAAHRADRFDFGEALLEISLVITSITLLTRRRAFWFTGIVLGIAGIAAAASAFLVH